MNPITRYSRITGKALGSFTRKLGDTRLNKSGTIGTEPISKNGKRYTEVKFGKLGAVDIPSIGKYKPMKAKTVSASSVSPARAVKKMGNPKGSY